jgi:citrate synthase
MRQEFTFRDQEEGPGYGEVIGSDEDSIPMELKPWGDKHAIYEFNNPDLPPKSTLDENLEEAFGTEACYHLIAGVSTIAAAVTRVRQGRVPIEPDPELSHAGNLLYMMTGKRPTAIEERIMDVALILHADHGMNASTFSALVVASTQSDIYFSVGSGIAALNGPLHGGANELVMQMMEEIGSPENVEKWLQKTLKKKGKVPGFGHRVYRAYDPRARVLDPLAKFLAKNNSKARNVFSIAKELEKQMTERLGSQKKIFPNVDFYSGIVYSCLGIPSNMFTPVFAVSRVAGWTARVHEYLHNNRIFRPRAMYTGEFNKELLPIDQRK